MVGPPEIGQSFLHSHLPAKLGRNSVSQGPQLHTKTNVGYDKNNYYHQGLEQTQRIDKSALGNSAQDFNFHSSG